MPGICRSPPCAGLSDGPPVTDPSEVDPPVLAAGALLWRRADHDGGDIEIALAHRPRYDDWSLPKGKLDPGESAARAAVREVREETGLEVHLGRPLPTQGYPVQGRAKVVYYWASEVDTSGEFVANDEVDELRWCPAATAGQLLSYSHDADVVTAFLADPVPTTPLTLLRHSHALSRSDWHGSDRDRPLSVEGSAAAERLPAELSCRGDLAALSSPARRCLDTLGPLVEWNTAAVPTHEWLAEEVFDDPTAGVRALLDTAGTPTVVCGHQPVLVELAAALGIDRSEASLSPAGAWILHLHRDQDGHVRLVASERLPTP